MITTSRTLPLVIKTATALLACDDKGAVWDSAYEDCSDELAEVVPIAVAEGVYEASAITPTADSDYSITGDASITITTPASDPTDAGAETGEVLPAIDFNVTSTVAGIEFGPFTLGMDGDGESDDIEATLTNWQFCRKEETTDTAAGDTGVAYDGNITMKLIFSLSEPDDAVSGRDMSDYSIIIYAMGDYDPDDQAIASFNADLVVTKDPGSFTDDVLYSLHKGVDIDNALEDDHKGDFTLTLEE